MVAVAASISTLISVEAATVVEMVAEAVEEIKLLYTRETLLHLMEEKVKNVGALPPAQQRFYDTLRGVLR